MAEPERCKQAQSLMCMCLQGGHLRRWQGKEIPALSAYAFIHKREMTHGEDSAPVAIALL